MIEAAAGSTVDFKFQTANTYRLCHESSFLVLPDGKTVVAPLYRNGSYNTLFAEDITTRNAGQIGTHSSGIYTVLYDPASRTLFAGDKSGRLSQYHKAEDSTCFSKSKGYGNVGLGYIYSCALVKGLAIFGGSNNCIIAVDAQSKQVLSGFVVTSFRFVYSLTPCEVSGSRTLLSVAGQSPGYSDTRTDIFELEFQESEDDLLSTTTIASSQPPPETMTFPGVQSQNLVNIIVSGLRGYVKELFSDFIRVYLEKLVELQGKAGVAKVSKNTTDHSNDSDLAEKVQKVVDDFRLDTKGNYAFFDSQTSLKTSTTISTSRTGHSK